jgi:hypothetical protein
VKNQFKRYNWIENVILVVGFLVIGLPLYPSNKLLDYIKIMGTSINIFQIILIGVILTILFGMCKKSYIGINKKDTAIWLLLIITAIHLFYGIVVKNNMEYILRDLNLYLFPIIIYCVFSYFFRRNRWNIDDILTYLFYAVFFVCSLNILMYLTKNLSFWGVETFSGGRFGGSYLSTITLVGGYAIHQIFNNFYNIKKIYILSFFILSTWSIVLSQSRGLLIFTLISYIIIALINIMPKQKLVIKRKVYFFIVFISVLIIICIIIMNSNSGLASRIINTDLSSDTDSGIVRWNIYIYNIKLLLKQPFGAGLGALFPFYNGAGVLIGFSNTIDNSYLTIAEKMGVITGIIYIYVIIIKPIWYFLKNNKNKVYLGCLVAYSLFLINSSFLTAQTINGIGVSSITWILIAFIRSNNIGEAKNRYDNKRKRSNSN